MTGVQMAHVPYKGRQFAIPDLVSGQIQLMFDNMPSALPMVKDGKLRALGQTGAKRSAAAMLSAFISTAQALARAIVSSASPRLP